MLGTPVKTFCDHGVKFGLKFQESKCWCRLGRLLPEEKVCAGRGVFGRYDQAGDEVSIC